MSVNSTPESTTEDKFKAIKAMNAAAYMIFSAGSRDYLDVDSKPALQQPHGLGQRRVGFAYDEVDVLGVRRSALDQFKAVFFGPGSPDTSGLALLDNLVEEFAESDGRKVTARLSRTQHSAEGRLRGNLLFKVIEPPPEITRERNFILFSLAGHVLVRATYNVQDTEITVEHGLLTFSRNEYSPEGDIPRVQVGLPTRAFAMEK